MGWIHSRQFQRGQRFDGQIIHNQQIAGEKARKVDRVLDVRQGALCWVTGTVYMDLPLKPNILDDVAKDNYAAAPPPRTTYIDPLNPDKTQVMLEDESGRLRMTGTMLRTTHLVTGVIIAVLGTENSNGDFEVIDIKVPDFPVQPPRWELASTDKTESTIKRVENTTGKSSKIAFISGLGITGSSSDTLALELLTDYLLGYTGPGGEDESPARISRLIIAGNSLGNLETATAAAAMNGDGTAKKKVPKKYGYDASSYNASPITQLDNFLSELLPSLPVTLMPGENDPANFSLPQQGIHRAMLPRAKAYSSDGLPGDTSVEPGWFDNVTNPWEGYVDGWRFWGCSGQNVDDVLRYLDFADEDGNATNSDGDGETSVQIMEAMLRWRCAVPTAPDTLWCYPFQTHDPFILQACPHLFFIGNQSHFKTVVVVSEPAFRLDGPDTEMSNSADEPLATHVRLVSIPKFHETGELILVDSETLEVDVVKFQIFSGKEESK
ncbi:DNA polymerase delta subunit 2, putative [Talaromyces stipitatus ATCC 10500]|uniref:DNA-directed DNA polymerase n=1 Tax=Talaromyces stipitatus (strain ATCC 10500 / CBS 375.48 / QM 6759 / NRRL 1006) TaxID=441959 RepID=B8MJM0_TALSN|nr:DNA polymerase delta subunit 2, putative [Talaromyces stipitatus ATCC 10500]EED15220.1 DNA polymerase delta subunit 2, putative [Talaromyces stipitatus ATCC 10500]